MPKFNGFMARRRVQKRRAKLESYRRACAEVDARDRGVCQWCYRPGDHHHHIVFRSRGGPDSPDNLITLCVTCHGLAHAHKIAAVDLQARLVR